MARKNSKTTGTNPVPSPRSGQRGNFASKIDWINPRLSKEDVEWLDANDSEQPAVIFDFIDAIPDTANLSVKYDANSTRFLATLIFTDDDPHSAGVGVSLRAATRTDALFALAYYVGEKCGWRFESSSGGESLSRWG